MRIVLSILLVFSSTFALAKGGSVSGGDGGHGVFCPGFWGPRAQLLDLFEARKLYDANFTFTNQPLWTTEADWMKASLHQAYERFHGVIFDDKRADELFQVFKNFDDENVVLDFVPTIPDTHDFGSLKARIPAGCSLHQLAVYKRSASGRVVILVDARLWGRLSPIDRAALLIHEAFHPYFPNRDTTALRQFTMYLSAGIKFRQRNVEAFRQLVKTRQTVSTFR